VTAQGKDIDRYALKGWRKILKDYFAFEHEHGQRIEKRPTDLKAFIFSKSYALKLFFIRWSFFNPLG